jgi:hypothetical protein
MAARDEARSRSSTFYLIKSTPYRGTNLLDVNRLLS